MNDKIESICNDIQNYLRNEYRTTPSKNNKEKILTNIRYVSNKIYILERLSVGNDEIKSAIGYIREQHKEYNEFVSCNLDQDDKYFLEKIRQEKINTFINNIDNKLDEIIVYIYTNKIPTVK